MTDQSTAQDPLHRAREVLNEGAPNARIEVLRLLDEAIADVDGKEWDVKMTSAIDDLVSVHASVVAERDAAELRLSELDRAMYSCFEREPSLRKLNFSGVPVAEAFQMFVDCMLSDRSNFEAERDAAAKAANAAIAERDAALRDLTALRAELRAAVERVEAQVGDKSGGWQDMPRTAINLGSPKTVLLGAEGGPLPDATRRENLRLRAGMSRALQALDESLKDPSNE